MLFADIGEHPLVTHVAKIDPNSGEIVKDETPPEIDSLSNRFFRIEKDTTIKGDFSKIYLHGQELIFHSHDVCFFQSHYIVAEAGCDKQLCLYALESLEGMMLYRRKITVIHGYEFYTILPSLTEEKLMGLETQKVECTIQNLRRIMEHYFVTSFDFNPRIIPSKGPLETIIEKIKGVFTQIFSSL
jgi:hypothetical protein